MMQDPTRHVNVIYDVTNTKWKIKSKKFNPKWLWNPFWVLLCIIAASLISYFAYKYGGEIGFIISTYFAFQLGRVAMFFIFDPEHEFWNVEWESCVNMNETEV